MQTETLVNEFEKALNKIGGSLSQPIDCSTWFAPHQPKALPARAVAVYVFFIDNGALPSRVLKVGKAGPKSGPRYLSQHYNFSAPSTLAKAILYNPILWGELGIDEIAQDEVGNWIKLNTGRMNFHLFEEDQQWLGHLEVFLRGKLSPMMEGVQTKEYAA